MARALRRLAWTLVIVTAFVALGCSDDNESPTATVGPTLEVVVGAVTRIDDQVPIDGGVTLDLATSKGKTDVAYLPSFFTSPPPPPEKWEAYQVILRLDVGDWVRVTGKRTEHGLEIERLSILFP